MRLSQFIEVEIYGRGTVSRNTLLLEHFRTKTYLDEPYLMDEKRNVLIYTEKNY